MLDEIRYTCDGKRYKFVNIILRLLHFCSEYRVDTGKIFSIEKEITVLCNNHVFYEYILFYISVFYVNCSWHICKF